jgi:hydrogenase maturation protein HypF
MRGAVQGVGFRPFVFRLAEELRLAGWVNNSPQGVLIEAEGPRPALEQFLARLETEKPARSFIQSLEPSWLDATGYTDFQIRKSSATGGKSALVPPDIGTCPDCLREIFDPGNRRFRHPFTNCTNCGPRFTIIEALPYDRANTSMKKFAMCPRCQAEYDNPHDRRFHAQPNACPVCGPRLELWSDTGERIFGGNRALLAAAQMVRRGRIVAVKGIGGFHLFADARNDATVARLRERKHREEKPFALLFPSLENVKAVCEVSPAEERLLRSPESPIVLLRRLDSALRTPHSALSSLVAPGNPNLGVMLPSNPLHHLLMAELNFPVIATSGNLSDEPICTDAHEALGRLRGIADLFLVHDRPIVRHVDDSIVRVMLGREMLMRRARGYAPLPVTLNLQPLTSNHRPILAVGAHLKNTVALAVGENVFISQHIGDLETEQAGDAFRRVIADFETLYEAPPEAIAADLHPDYLSTKFARDTGKPVFGVQHHVAHVLSCIAENEVALPALGVAWDGTGYGTDGTIWGGEFFLVTENSVERIAHLRPFRLPGGDAAVKEPRRAALGLLHELFGDEVFTRKELPPVAAFSTAELATVKTMLKRKLNSPLTSSIGRLFDAVASLAGLRQRMRFEGQAAMELEFALAGIQTAKTYQLPIIEGKTTFNLQPSTFNLTLDWSPLVKDVILDVGAGVPAGVIAAKFHHALAEAVAAVAQKAGVPRVALSGGCFQNRYLTERTAERLRAGQFSPYWHQRVPPNDGGVALGQVFAARRQMQLK